MVLMNILKWLAKRNQQKIRNDELKTRKNKRMAIKEDEMSTQEKVGWAYGRFSHETRDRWRGGRV